MAVLMMATTALSEKKAGPSYTDYNMFFGTEKFNVRLWESGSCYETLSSWQGSGELEEGSNPDKHSTYADPLFINPGGDCPDDYRLDKTSPARGAGKSRQDIGAYPFGDAKENIGFNP